VSSRVLRDDLWTSERVNALHDKTFRLYLCLFNAADDYGLVEIGFGDIRRAAPLLSWTREDIAKMLGELVDAGLIRPYDHAGKAFAAIERWQPFLRATRPRHPIPSFGMGHVRMPYGFKDRRTKIGATLILKHLKIEIAPLGAPEGNPGDSLGSIGLRELGSGGVRELGKDLKDLEPSHSVDISASAAPNAAPHCPVDQIVQLWNQIVAQAGGKRVLNVSKTRRAMIGCRWREVGPESVDEGLRWFESLFRDRIAPSKFATGRQPDKDGRAFRIGIDSALRSEQVVDQILEGKYA